jgi:hypothetical protein
MQHWCSGENEGVTVIAHNFKGYDTLPIQGYLYQNGVKPTIIANGAKNMYIEVPECRIRMIDYINFLPSALSDIDKSVQLCSVRQTPIRSFHMFDRYCLYRRLDPCILSTLYVLHIDYAYVRKLHTSVICNEYIFRCHPIGDQHALISTTRRRHWETQRAPPITNVRTADKP